MMGTKEKLRGGDEYDFLTRARRWYVKRRGEVKRVKRRFWKRVRKLTKRQIQNGGT